MFAGIPWWANESNTNITYTQTIVTGPCLRIVLAAAMLTCYLQVAVSVLAARVTQLASDL